MKDAVAVFNEWAELDKDLGMEKGHADAVTEMLDFALKERHRIDNDFTFLDLGCGNGWVVRRVVDDPLCSKARGIDGADQMIAHAKHEEITKITFLQTSITMSLKKNMILFTRWKFCII